MSQPESSRLALPLALLGHLPERLEAAGADGPVVGAAGAVEGAAGRHGVAGGEAGGAGAVAGDDGGEHALALGLEAGQRHGGPLRQRELRAPGDGLLALGHLGGTVMEKRSARVFLYRGKGEKKKSWGGQRLTHT